MHKYKLYSIVLAIVLVLSSCIDDSNSDCPKEVRLAVGFEYFGDGNTNVLTNNIYSSYILVYNAEGLLSKSVIADSFELASSKDVYLEPGKYTLVLWGNYGVNSALDHPKDLSKAYLTTPQYLINQIPVTNDALYFARQEIEVLPGRAPLTEWVQEVKVEFKSAHIGMKVLVRGLEEDDQAELRITNLAPYNNFEMRYQGAELITYKQEQTPNTIIEPLTGEFYEMNTFRFKDDNSIEIHLIDPQTQLDLIEPILLKDILDKQSLSIENLQEVTLFLEVTIDNSNISISIKSWDDIETIPSN